MLNIVDELVNDESNSITFTILGGFCLVNSLQVYLNFHMLKLQAIEYQVATNVGFLIGSLIAFFIPFFIWTYINGSLIALFILQGRNPKQRLISSITTISFIIPFLVHSFFLVLNAFYIVILYSRILIFISWLFTLLLIGVLIKKETTIPWEDIGLAISVPCFLVPASIWYFIFR